MVEREMFEQWYIENAFDYEANPLGSRECGLQWQAWQAARRTTPDREAIIEECAKVCEAWSASIDTGRKRNRVVSAAMQGALTCAFEIRALKTALTSDKGD